MIYIKMFWCVDIYHKFWYIYSFVYRNRFNNIFFTKNRKFFQNQNVRLKNHYDFCLLIFFVRLYFRKYINVHCYERIFQNRMFKRTNVNVAKITHCFWREIHKFKCLLKFDARAAITNSMNMWKTWNNNKLQLY